MASSAELAVGMEAGRGIVAVVGASSQIGQALLPRLYALGYSVFRVGRQSKNTSSEVIHIFDESRRSFGPEIKAAEIVISLAPLPSIGAVVNMACALGATRIIAFGSAGRFSKSDSESIVEKDFVAQQERAESIFMTSCEAAGVGWTLFRPTMIYGADLDQNISFIRAIIRRFHFFPLPIGSNGLRQPVHVDDLANACIAVIERRAGVNRAYNLGGGEILTFPNLVRRIFIAEKKCPILVPVPRLLFVLLVSVSKRFSSFAFVRKEMIDRMFKDLVVDNQPAANDFGYAPKSFRL